MVGRARTGIDRGEYFFCGNRGIRFWKPAFAVPEVDAKLCSEILELETQSKTERDKVAHLDARVGMNTRAGRASRE